MKAANAVGAAVGGAAVDVAIGLRAKNPFVVYAPYTCNIHTCYGRERLPRTAGLA